MNPITPEQLQNIQAELERSSLKFPPMTAELEDESDPNGTVLFKDNRGFTRMAMSRALYDELRTSRAIPTPLKSPKRRMCVWCKRDDVRGIAPSPDGYACTDVESCSRRSSRPKPRRR